MWAALISERLSPSIVHEGPMPLIQLLLVLVPQDTFLLFEIPSAITLQVVATWSFRAAAWNILEHFGTFWNILEHFGTSWQLGGGQGSCFFWSQSHRAGERHGENPMMDILNQNQPYEALSQLSTSECYADLGGTKKRSGFFYTQNRPSQSSKSEWPLNRGFHKWGYL